MIASFRYLIWIEISTVKWTISQNSQHFSYERGFSSLILIDVFLYFYVENWINQEYWEANVLG